MQEQWVYNWQVGFCIQCDGFFQVRFQGGEDGGYMGEMGDGFCVVVKLLVVVRMVIFVGVYYWCEGVEIVLVQQQFFVVFYFKQGGVIVNVVVVQVMFGYCQ